MPAWRSIMDLKRPKLKKLTEAQLASFFKVMSIKNLDVQTHYREENETGDIVTDGCHVYSVFDLKGTQYSYIGGMEISAMTLECK